MKDTGTLAVEAEVLGERLGDAKLKALFDKVANGPGVVVEVTAGKALVGAVKEGEQALLLHDLGNIGPLFPGRVDTCGVVGAGVEDDDAAFWRVVKGGREAVKVETAGGGMVIGVRGCREGSVLKDLLVVGPGGVGKENGLVLWARKELLEEACTGVERTGSGDSLDRSNLKIVILASWPVKIDEATKQRERENVPVLLPEQDCHRPVLIVRQRM